MAHTPRSDALQGQQASVVPQPERRNSAPSRTSIAAKDSVAPAYAGVPDSDSIALPPRAARHRDPAPAPVRLARRPAFQSPQLVEWSLSREGISRVLFPRAAHLPR